MGKLRLARPQQQKSNRTLHNLIGLGLILIAASVYGGTTYYFYQKNQGAKVEKVKPLPAPKLAPTPEPKVVAAPVKQKEDLTAVASPDKPPVSTIAPGPGLDKAEQLVKLQLQALDSARSQAAAAEAARSQLHTTYKGVNLNNAAYQAVMARYQAADDACAKAQAQVELLQKGFELVNENYRTAGGPKEYSSSK